MKQLNSIMLIDDDSTTNFINELLIIELKISKEIIIASNGKEALDLISRSSIMNGYFPDLILLDINMPIMDGFEFLEAFDKLEYENKNSSIIVMLTTSLNPNDVKRAEDLKVKGYINKPLLEEGMRDILNKYFN